MGWLTMPLLWAQAAGSASGAAASAGSAAGVGNPAAMASMAFRRWCSGLTLSSPEVVPGMDGFWAFLTGLAVLLAVAILFQGPLLALHQLIDIPGHIALVRQATRRVWRGAVGLGAHHVHSTCLDRQPDPRLSGRQIGQGKDGAHVAYPFRASGSNWFLNREFSAV